MVNMETGLRGFLYNKKEEYLEPYNNSKNLINNHFVQYKVNEAIQRAANSWINDYAEKAIQLNKEVISILTMDSFYKEFSNVKGKAYMDDIRKKIETFTSTELSLLDTRKAKMERTATLTKFLLIIITLLAIIITIAIIILITKRLMEQLGGEPAEVNQIAQSIANGDLTIKVDTSRKMTGIYAAMIDLTEKLKGVIINIVAGSENISSASAEISSTAQQMSQGASEQASSVEEVSSSMEQMSSNIEQNTDNSQQTDKIATKAAEEILQGSKAVNETVISMKTIAEKVSIISEIAFQTNILALNAAVEAARAGEHGKGFAVVAAEVRKLAERSQIAAKEIGALTKSSVEIAEKTGTLFVEIVPSIQNTAKLVQEITASSAEQSNGANQISSAIEQLNQVAQQNAAASEELATSAEEMTSQAEQLQDIVSYFKVDTQIKRQQIKQIKKQQTKFAHMNVKQNISKGINLNLKDKSVNEFETF